MAQVITPDVLRALPDEDEERIRVALRQLLGADYNRTRGVTFHRDMIVVEKHKLNEEGKCYLDRVTNDAAVEFVQLDRVWFDEETEISLNRAWHMSHDMNEGEFEDEPVSDV